MNLRDGDVLFCLLYMQRFVHTDKVKIWENVLFPEFYRQRRGWWAESPKGSGIVGRDNCMDSEHFDPLSSQRLNLLRFITLFTLNRSTLYCFSVCIQMPCKEGIWLLNTSQCSKLVQTKWHVLLQLRNKMLHMETMQCVSFSLWGDERSAFASVDLIFSFLLWTRPVSGEQNLHTNSSPKHKTEQIKELNKWIRMSFKLTADKASTIYTQSSPSSRVISKCLLQCCFCIKTSQRLFVSTHQ